MAEHLKRSEEEAKLQLDEVQRQGKIQLGELEVVHACGCASCALVQARARKSILFLRASLCTSDFPSKLRCLQKDLAETRREMAEILARMKQEQAQAQNAEANRKSAMQIAENQVQVLDDSLMQRREIERLKLELRSSGGYRAAQESEIQQLQQEVIESRAREADARKSEAACAARFQSVLKTALAADIDLVKKGTLRSEEEAKLQLEEVQRQGKIQLGELEVVHACGCASCALVQARARKSILFLRASLCTSDFPSKLRCLQKDLAETRREMAEILARMKQEQAQAQNAEANRKSAMQIAENQVQVLDDSLTALAADIDLVKKGTLVLSASLQESKHQLQGVIEMRKHDVDRLEARAAGLQEDVVKTREELKVATKRERELTEQFHEAEKKLQDMQASVRVETRNDVEKSNDDEVQQRLAATEKDRDLLKEQLDALIQHSDEIIHELEETRSTLRATEAEKDVALSQLAQASEVMENHTVVLASLEAEKDVALSSLAQANEALEELMHHLPGAADEPGELTEQFHEAEKKLQELMHHLPGAADEPGHR